MNHSQPDPIPSDLLRVVGMLRDERPEATALELDRIKLRAKARAAQTRPSYFARQKGTPLMRSRTAITSMLVLGMMMTGTGATLATSGNSGSGSASEAAYPKTTPTTSVVTPVTPTSPQVQTLQPPAVQEAAQAPAAPEQSTLPPIRFIPTAPEQVDEAPVVRGQSEESPSPRKPTERRVAPAAQAAPAADVQPARQVAAAENQLPFTGFAALPILIGGLVLLVSGFTLRRQARNND